MFLNSLLLKSTSKALLIVLVLVLKVKDVIIMKTKLVISSC